MLSSIHPLGERARGNRWGVTVALFTAAAALGGALTGAVAGGLGALSGVAGSRWALALAGVAAVGALAIDASGANRALARPRRQVDEAWLTMYRRWVYAVGWGAQLGMGVLTVIPAATVWLVFVLAALTGSPATGAAVGAAFGLGRGVTLMAPAGVVDPERLRTFHARMAARSPAAHRLSIGADAAVALMVSATLLTGGSP
jgi:sulfite exporter TauE/SafE